MEVKHFPLPLNR